MMKAVNQPIRITGILMFTLLLTVRVFAQADLAPWGNMQGIRIDGQLMSFETAIVVVEGKKIQATGKEMQRPNYKRNGAEQIVTTAIDHLNITETVKDIAKSEANVAVIVKATEVQSIDSLFFAIKIPVLDFELGTVRSDKLNPVKLSDESMILKKYFKKAVQTLLFNAAGRQITFRFREPVRVLWRGSDKRNFVVMIPLHAGALSPATVVQKEFSIAVTGTVNHDPVSVQLDPSALGNVFDGFGGNFRLQNPTTDPQVIDYCLRNMRVAWGRVEMPWRFWQPNKEDNPTALMKAGKLDERIKNAMLMAQRLSKLNMPIILSAWSAPNWAIVGEPRFHPTPEGIWGNPLDKNNMNEIYKSIADYITYLKDEFGVEVSLFSFNESDLGINIRQTGEEHAALIKGLGGYLQSRGLKTKVLLGDNSDATTVAFIEPALYDPEALPFIGAISFHSWRGWEKELLQKWADASRKIDRPLIVGEGSIDAQAWGYPQIFLEPGYALNEINLYIRLLNICQPVSILQWQLTADYSPLSGGGIFGNNDPLKPTQRFWNLKQLASVPKGLKAMGATSDKPSISVAALGNDAGNVLSIHLVNNGPSRTTNLSGIPPTITSLNLVVTNQQNAMQEKQHVDVHDGKATFTLDELSYVTLYTN